MRDPLEITTCLSLGEFTSEEALSLLAPPNASNSSPHVVEPNHCQELKSICGKLKSAWALRIGFETRLDGLLPIIAAIPSDEIDQHIDSIAKGDAVKEMALMLISTEHLFHPSLHHRISGWLANDALPYRDRLIRAIGRFRLHHVAKLLNPLLLRNDSADSTNTWIAALTTIPLLKSLENYEMLSRLIGVEDSWQNRLMADSLSAFAEFNSETYFRRRFLESQVVDEVALCEAFLRGEISEIERMQQGDQAYVIWRNAERYAEFARKEVFQFLVQHLEFDQTWFSSERFSQTILCRGHVATSIIARVNGWLVNDHEQTKERGERQTAFSRRFGTL